MQVAWARVIRRVLSDEAVFVVAVGILLLGLVLGYFVWRSVYRLLREAGIPEAVEGTAFERTARSLGTSTVGLVAGLSAVFVYTGAVILALNVSQLVAAFSFWARLTGYLPNVFVATFALIVGLIAGDKAKLVLSERLRSVKFPEADVLPTLLKYSIFYLAALVALGQLGIAVSALLVLLAAYAFGLVFLGGLAFRQLLAAAGAGLFLVLAQPYSIGDEVEIDDRHGVVQEVGMFVTHVEDDGTEYIVPNQRVFESGVVRVRE